MDLKFTEEEELIHLTSKLKIKIDEVSFYYISKVNEVNINLFYKEQFIGCVLGIYAQVNGRFEIVEYEQPNLLLRLAEYQSN